MRIAALVILTMLSGVTQADRSNGGPMKATQQSNSTSNSVRDQRRQIRVSISTGGGPYRPGKDSYRGGERVPVVITMTNTGSQPVYVCESGALYQDRPQLLKDGKPVPYISFQQSSIQMAAKNKTCDKDNLPQQIQLRPTKPPVPHSFLLSKGST